MAHAYTTKRGKNKMAKLGVRKDHQQNQERQLKSVDDNRKYDGPKEEMEAKIAGHIGFHKSSSSSSATSLLMDSEKVKCGNPLCSVPSSNLDKLMDCSGCRTLRYCSRECQLTHWSDHKESCKAARKLRLKEEDDRKIVASLSASFGKLHTDEMEIEASLAASLNRAIVEATAAASLPSQS